MPAELPTLWWTSDKLSGVEYREGDTSLGRGKPVPFNAPLVCPVQAIPSTR